MALSIKNNSSRKVWTGISSFSEKTNKLVDECINELLNCGIPINEKVCYFHLINGIWHLNMSVKYLGFLDEKRGDELFKALIRSVESDVGHDLICIIFPNNVSGCPYGEFTVLTDESLVSKILSFISNSVRVIAYNENRIPESLRNFCFSCGDESSLRDMLISCGNARTMASSLNNSGFGYTNWEPVENNYKRMVIGCKDTWGNKHYIRVVL